MRRLIIVVLITSVAIGSMAGAQTSEQSPPDTASLKDSTGGQLLVARMAGGESPSAAIDMQALEAEDQQLGVDPARVLRPTRPRTCQVYSVPGPGTAGSENNELEAVAGSLVVDDWYYQTCTYTDTGELSYSGYWQYQPGDPVNPGPDLAAMARQAFDQVPLAFPVPATSPGVDDDQITGLPTWLWIDPGGWGELSARAEIPGFWVEVVARPRHVVWDMGGGDEVVCDGPGTPYDPNRSAEEQSTDCSHVYRYVSSGEPDGRYAASVTIVWSVGWRASTGATGVLTDASRTTTFSLSVTERQAVVTYDP